MFDVRPIKKHMLVGLTEVRVPDAGLDFSAARRVADETAGDKLEYPFLLAWYDRKASRHSPFIC
jgi:hypothetical protein